MRTIRKMKALVVDDDPTLRALFAELLGEDGHEVVTAGDGAEAVRLASQSRFALVLLDCEMPVMDGLAAARAIRALPGPVPSIVMISSRDDAATRADAAAAGIEHYLTKPVSVVRLRRLVEEYAARG